MNDRSQIKLKRDFQDECIAFIPNFIIDHINESIIFSKIKNEDHKPIIHITSFEIYNKINNKKDEITITKNKEDINLDSYFVKQGSSFVFKTNVDHAITMMLVDAGYRCSVNNYSIKIYL